nr:glucosaminidase domain-containing protein [Candidatus Sodalis pierantonius]
MKIRAAQASSQGVADAARQVEGLFVDMMLKSMRATLPQEGLLTSAQTQLYTSLYDQQLAQDLTARGVGLAQAALESGWGARKIRTAHGAPSHNLFGIKADAGWRGESTQITTTEWVDGVMQKVKAKFRVYASYGEALRDYTRLLTENTRYRRVMQASTPEQAARSLQSSGYATDPHYADKLITIIAQLKTVGQRAQAAYQHDLATLF